MSEMYKCPKCRKETLIIKDINNHREYNCLSCAYRYIEEKTKDKQQKRQLPQKQKKNNNPLNFIQTFSFLNKVSGFLIIILLVVFMILFAVAYSDIGSTNTRIDFVDYESSLRDNNIKNQFTENISELNDNINNIDSKFLNLENKLNNLNYVPETLIDIEDNITTLKNNISQVQENISKIWMYNAGLGNPNRNLTITYFANQTYCHVKFLTEKNIENINEVKFSLQYQNVNISLLNWSGKIKPQEYQYTNGNHTDNYYLHWFEQNNNYMATFNISWDISDYNTSKIPKSNMTYNLMLNGFVYSIPTIWEEEIL